jgi:hypothetical protein
MVIAPIHRHTDAGTFAQIHRKNVQKLYGWQQSVVFVFAVVCFQPAKSDRKWDPKATEKWNQFDLFSVAVGACFLLLFSLQEKGHWFTQIIQLLHLISRSLFTGQQHMPRLAPLHKHTDKNMQMINHLLN